MVLSCIRLLWFVLFNRLIAKSITDCDLRSSTSKLFSKCSVDFLYKCVFLLFVFLFILFEILQLKITMILGCTLKHRWVQIR